MIQNQKTENKGTRNPYKLPNQTFKMKQVKGEENQSEKIGVIRDMEPFPRFKHNTRPTLLKLRNISFEHYTITHQPNIPDNHQTNNANQSSFLRHLHQMVLE